MGKERGRWGERGEIGWREVEAEERLRERRIEVEGEKGRRSEVGKKKNSKNS